MKIGKYIINIKIYKYVKGTGGYTVVYDNHKELNN